MFEIVRFKGYNLHYYGHSGLSENDLLGDTFAFIEYEGNLFSDVGKCVC